MVLPVVAGVVGAAAAAKAIELGDYALGRPMELWQRTITAEQDAQVRSAAYRGNLARPNMLPSPEAIYSAWRRGLISNEVAADALVSQGVMPGMGTVRGIASDMDGHTAAWYYRLWRNVSTMSQSRPSPETAMHLSYQRRLTDPQWQLLWSHLDADYERYRIATEAQYQSPGIDLLIQLYRRGAINASEYDTWARRVGWWDTEARDLLHRVSQLPSLMDCVVAGWRGKITPDQYQRYTHALGWVDPPGLQVLLDANRPMPGPADLVRFSVREVWDQAVVDRWKYDEEFPAPFAAWMRWQGMDWGEDIATGKGRSTGAVPWPLAYWRAHWQIMSPTQAYRAIHLLRSNRIARYQELAPGVTPFTAEDLSTVLKVSDYPQPMRQWLAAIAFNPLRLTDIRGLYITGRRDRAWAIDQLLDRGYVRDDAESAVVLWDSADLLADLSSRRSLRRRVMNETVAALRQAHQEGVVDRPTARAHLLGLGIDAATSDRMLYLDDARVAREGMRVFMRQLRRSYLQGALERVQARDSLVSAGVAAARADQYLHLWTLTLDAERRSLSTSQIAQQVAAGALSPADAAVRLGRLGWTQPDAALLIQQAVARLTRAQASAARQAANTTARQTKALQAAQRQAQAAARSAQGQLRRIYPLASLKRQFCLGIRKGPTIAALLASQGYTPDSIAGLLSQWAHECEASPPAPDKRVGSLESYNRRQTPLGTIKQWWQNGVVTDTWARARLASIGLEPGAIDLQIQLWRSTLGKKSGPSTQATAQTQPQL